MVEIQSTRAYVPQIEDRLDAEEVSAWIAGHGEDMVQRSPDDLLKLFGQRRSLLLQAQVDGEWRNAAHVAITHVYEDGSAELGAVVSNPDFRGNGQGAAVAGEAMERLMASDIVEEFPAVFALVLLANLKSMRMFTGLDFADRIADMSVLPDAAFGEAINGEVGDQDQYAGFLMRRVNRTQAMQATPAPASQIGMRG